MCTVTERIGLGDYGRRRQITVAGRGRARRRRERALKTPVLRGRGFLSRNALGLSGKGKPAKWGFVLAVEHKPKHHSWDSWPQRGAAHVRDSWGCLY